jgi:uncharacterized protein YigE (DUF2233 family)
MLRTVQGAARAAPFVFLLLLAACREGEQSQEGRFDPATLTPAPACEERIFEGSRFSVCRYDATRDEIRLAWKGRDGAALRSLGALQASLGAEAERVRFAVNAGMYDAGGAPVGLYVEGGETLRRLNTNKGPGNFHLLPNGVFAVEGNGAVSVSTAQAFAKRKNAPAFATQSGPMLVIKGKLHPKFDADGPSRLVRNGVGVSNKRTAYFAISEEGVSFGRFARLFRDALGCADALYLDGSVSSLWDAPAGRQDPYSALGPMVAVLRKE